MPARKRTKAKGQRRIVRRTKSVYASGAAEVPEVFEWQYVWGKTDRTPSFVLTTDRGTYHAHPAKMEISFRPDGGKMESLGKFSVGAGEVQEAVKRHMRGEVSVWQRVRKALKLNPSEADMMATPEMRKAWVRKVARQHGEPMPNPAFVDWLFGIDRPHRPAWKRFYAKQGKKNRDLIALMKKLKVPYRNLGYDRKNEVFTIGVDMGYVDQVLPYGDQLDVVNAIADVRVRPVMMSPGVRAWMPERFAVANPRMRLRQMLEQVPRRTVSEAEAFQMGQEHVLDVLRHTGPGRWVHGTSPVITNRANPFIWGTAEFDAWWDGVGEAIAALSYVTPGGQKADRPRRRAKKKSKRSLSSRERAAILRRAMGAR